MQALTEQPNKVEEKSRAGRPKTDNPRNVRLTLLFTNEEYMALIKEADPQRITDYARQVLLNSLPI